MSDQKWAIYQPNGRIMPNEGTCKQPFDTREEAEKALDERRMAWADSASLARIQWGRARVFPYNGDRIDPFKATQCRFCDSKNCEHGDHCGDCGCPKCGYPGARFEENGFVRGFCADCEWEAVPGAFDAWKARQPSKTSHEMYRDLMSAFGVDLPPDDEVGTPILEVVYE